MHGAVHLAGLNGQNQEAEYDNIIDVVSSSSARLMQNSNSAHNDNDNTNNSNDTSPPLLEATLVGDDGPGRRFNSSTPVVTAENLPTPPRVNWNDIKVQFGSTTILVCFVTMIGAILSVTYGGIDGRRGVAGNEIQTDATESPTTATIVEPTMAQPSFNPNNSTSFPSMEPTLSSLFFPSKLNLTVPMNANDSNNNSDYYDDPRNNPVFELSTTTGMLSDATCCSNFIHSGFV